MANQKLGSATGYALHSSTPAVFGQAYGPGHTYIEPEIATLAGELGLAGPRAISTRPPAIDFDEETLRFLVCGLVCGDPQVQRYIVDTYATDDVEFVHLFGSCRGKERYLQVYRGATTFMDYRIVFRDIIIGGGKAFLWLDLRLRPSVPILSRRTLPCLIVMHFIADPITGRPKICLQHDHFSLTLFTWMGGRLAQQVSDAFVRPLTGIFVLWQYTTYEAIKAWVFSLFGAEAPTPSPARLLPPNALPGGGKADGLNAVEASALDATMRRAVSRLAPGIVAVDSEPDFWEELGWIGLPFRVWFGLWGAAIGWVLTWCTFLVQLVQPYV